MTVQTSNPRPLDVRDNSFALAIAVLRERIATLPKADQDDLYQLLPELFCGDEESREAAIRAVNEILTGNSATLRPMNLADQSTSELSGWIAHFSQRLKQARDEAGMTQQELGVASGIPQSHISRLEAGQHSPSAKTVEKLSKALGKPASYFDPCAD